MSDSEDEDLLRAIALSLGEPLPSNRAIQGVINLDSDSEDASSLARQHTAIKETQKLMQAPSASKSPANGHSGFVPESNLGLLGLDRKKMEAERLARKRKASISPPPARKLVKSSPSTSVSVRYSRGVVKKTWVSGHPRVGEDIKLEEVLQQNDLLLAVLSSFQWDIPWLLAKIADKTKITLIMQAEEEATRQQYKKETSGIPNLRLCFPSMEGQIHCMHSKLMLLSYRLYLRIVVPTANLVSYDWGETGEMENTVFLIDLPRLHDGERKSEKVGRSNCS